ncbi:MAG: hypothetical protein JXR94_11040 [Candidatus Hydrogenedentes bacterium]|nr:hypothetical protein [Candidatus Hydrogenedentota bacterium]
MADDKPQNGEGTPEEELPGGFGDFASDDSGGSDAGGDVTDSGLGNLPPLSDFESSAADGGGFDSSLPPLGSMDSDGGLDSDGQSSGALPPISDIPVETPIPTGGNVKAAPPGFEDTPAFDTPGSDSGIDTPSDTPDTPVSDASTAFQDLAADSDFTPETPEVAPPGPDSDMETPMFDSAFGGDDSELSGMADTSAPTQAMESPMFGMDAQAPAGAPGFDEDAFEVGGFGGADEADDDGTPMPDFSADTGAAMAAAPAEMAVPDIGGGPVRTGGEKPKSKLVSILISALVLIVGLAVGVFIGPTVAHKFAGLPTMNPWPDDLAAKDKVIADKQKLIDDMTAAPKDGGEQLTPEQIQELIAQKKQVVEELDGLTKNKEALTGEVAKLKKDLEQVRADLEAKTEEYVQANADFEDLQNQTEIVRAQQQGLLAEVDRLQEMVGLLEDANTRRALSKQALESHIDELAVQVREGNPLTPEKYARADRVAEIEELRSLADESKWVSPELIEAYTALFLKELNIAATREYFYAKVPVMDRFGTRNMVWAECLMNGNWSTYYRSIDGEHVGVYQNVGGAEPARYDFVEADLSENARKSIEEQIVLERPEGWAERVAILTQRQQALEHKSDLQRTMDSL